MYGIFRAIYIHTYIYLKKQPNVNIPTGAFVCHRQNTLWTNTTHSSAATRFKRISFTVVWTSQFKEQIVKWIGQIIGIFGFLLQIVDSPNNEATGHSHHRILSIFIQKGQSMSTAVKLHLAWVIFPRHDKRHQRGMKSSKVLRLLFGYLHQSLMKASKRLTAG